MVRRAMTRLQRWIAAARPRPGHDAGATAILVAICAPVLLTIVGFTIDYSYASYVNATLTRATDASVLAAVSQSAGTGVGGFGNVNDLQKYGTNVFKAGILNAPSSNVGYNLSVTQPTANGLVTATGSYNYNVPTFFGGLLGKPSITVTSTIKATAVPPTYINYYLLIDVSNSMGIASTQQDMTNLYNATKSYNTVFQQDKTYGETGCVFACHNSSSSWNTGVSTEKVARDNNISLRIDAAKSAIQSVINSASATASNTRNISFGIYLLQHDSNTGKDYVTLNAQTTDYPTLLNKVSAIDLINTSGFGETNTKNFLSDIGSMMPSNGSGTSATSPLNYVFLVTDGVADVYGISCPTAACFYPVTSSWCDAIKAKSTLGVIYTTYLEIWKNNNPATNTYETLYANYVASYKDQIQPNLTNCATATDYFFQADDGPAIVTQMQALFAKTQPVSARLTQ